jgi:hypothetical protein
MCERTVSILLRIGRDGGLLWIRQWTFGFHKIRGNFLRSWRPVSFSGREGLCFMELVRYIIKYYYICLRYAVIIIYYFNNNNNNSNNTRACGRCLQSQFQASLLLTSTKCSVSCVGGCLTCHPAIQPLAERWHTAGGRRSMFLLCTHMWTDWGSQISRSLLSSQHRPFFVLWRWLFSLRC